MITFSVVVPLYNKERYIARAINSVLNQTIEDYDIIIVDDGSTDGSAKVVKLLDDHRIRLIYQENGGVSSARNKGIMESKGKMIAFLDADDEWKPVFLETILRLMKKHPEAGLYATAYEINTPFNKLQRASFRAIPPKPLECLIPNYFRSAALGKPPVCSSAVCIPKHIFDNIGMFSVGERLGEDLDMWGRIAIRYPVAFSWVTGAIYNLNSENSACLNQPHTKELPFVRSARAAIENKIVSETILKDLRAYITRLQLIVARDSIISGNNATARKVLHDCEGRFFFKKRLWLSFWALMPGKLTKSIWSFRCLLQTKLGKIGK